jgi:hypothetical protein
LYFSIRIGEISFIGLLPSALINGRERNSSCTHVRLLTLDQGRKVSAMKSRSNGAEFSVYRKYLHTLDRELRVRRVRLAP